MFHSVVLMMYIQNEIITTELNLEQLTSFHIFHLIFLNNIHLGKAGGYNSQNMIKKNNDEDNSTKT